MRSRRRNIVLPGYLGGLTSINSNDARRGSDIHEKHLARLVFTSNRGENTVSVFAPGREQESFKIPVGVKPNGLAFDSTRGILIAANVGDPSIPDSYSVSVVDLARRERVAEVKVPGRTRWAIHDESARLGHERTCHCREARNRFHVSISRGVNHVHGIVAGMRDVEPIRSLMDISVIEPALGSIRRELDMAEQTKRHRRSSDQSAGVTV